MAQTFSEDQGVGQSYDGSLTNSSTQTVFTGTASSAFTLNGVTETISQMFTLDTQGQPTYFPPSFAAGAPVLFAVAPGEIVTITPLASTPSTSTPSNGFDYRQASGVLTLSSPPAVPEPSTLAPFALASLGLLGLTLRARRKNKSA